MPATTKELIKKQKEKTYTHKQAPKYELRGKGSRGEGGEPEKKGGKTNHFEAEAAHDDFSVVVHAKNAFFLHKGGG